MDARLLDDEFPTRNPMAEDCRASGTILPDRDWFMRSARYVWPVGTPKALQFELEKVDHVEYSDRTCRAWTSGDGEPPCHKLVLLLRGEEGRRFLDLAMEGAEPSWWREHLEARRKADLADAFVMGLENAGQNDGDGRASKGNGRMDT